MDPIVVAIKVVEPIEISMLPVITTNANPEAIIIMGTAECSIIMMFSRCKKLGLLKVKPKNIKIIIKIKP
jgi:hypothetical protein